MHLRECQVIEGVEISGCLMLKRQVGRGGVGMGGGWRSMRELNMSAMLVWRDKANKKLV